MKKFLAMAAAAAMMTGLAQAEVVFDLGAQQLYYPITKLADSYGDYTIDQFREASYDTGKAIASTGMTSVNGYYRPEGDRTGNFGVQIKEPKANSAVTFGMYCYLDDDGCSVQLLGSDGKAININFDYFYNYDKGWYGRTSVDGQYLYGIGNKETNINGAVEINPTNITVTINGTYKFTIDKPNFKLATVNVSLYTDSASSIDYIDKLTSLSVSNSD